MWNGVRDARHWSREHNYGDLPNLYRYRKEVKGDGDRKMKAIIRIERRGTVEDLDKRFDLTLVSDSWDVDNIKGYFGNPPELEEFRCFLIKTGKENYEEMYGIRSSTPWLSQPVYKIELTFIDEITEGLIKDALEQLKKAGIIIKPETLKVTDKQNEFEVNCIMEEATAEAVKRMKPTYIF